MRRERRSTYLAAGLRSVEPLSSEMRFAPMMSPLELMAVAELESLGRASILVESGCSTRLQDARPGVGLSIAAPATIGNAARAR